MTDDRTATELLEALAEKLGAHSVALALWKADGYRDVLAALEAARDRLCFWCSMHKPFDADGKHEVMTTFAMSPDNPVLFTHRCDAVPEREALAEQRVRLLEALR
jgi:hypothetical protein